MELGSLTLTRERAIPVARLDAVATLAALAGSAFLYALFIAESSFRIDGRLTFSLFDDAMISMTYARNLAEGHGLVWNAGEVPVEGYTNFLWTLWMAVLHLLPVGTGRVSLLVMATGAALLLANALVVRAIVRRLAPQSSWAAPLATAAVALYYPLAYWTLRGTEVGLVALLTSTAVLLALRLEPGAARRDVALLAAVLGAGLLTRTDFAVTALVVTAFVGLRNRRAGLVLAGIAASTLAAHTAFRLAYYGAPLPNTYYLKVGGVSLGTRASRGALALKATAFSHLYVPLVLAAAGVAVRAVRGRLKRPMILLAALVAAQAAYSVYVGGDAWEWMQFSNRYLCPVVPLLLIGAVLGLRELARAPRVLVWPVVGAFVLVGIVASTHAPEFEHLQRWSFSAYRPVTASTLCVAAAFGLAHPRLRPFALVALAAALLVTPNVQPVKMWRAEGAYHVHDDAAAVRYGLALRRNTDPRARIAVVWAGAIPYFAGRRSIDLLGKSDPVVAHEKPRTDLFHPGHTKWDSAYSLGVLQPDLVAQVFDAGDTERVPGYEIVHADRWHGLLVLVRRGSLLVNRDGLRRYFHAAGA